MHKLSVHVDCTWFGNIAWLGIVYRTSINEVNKKRHLGLAKKTSLLHSLKPPLIYECNKSNIVKWPWIFIANWKYAESGINEDEGILKLWLWRLMSEKQRQVSKGYNITLNFRFFLLHIHKFNLNIESICKSWSASTYAVKLWTL